MIESAQVGERHVDLGHRVQLRGPRRCATRLRLRGGEGVRPLDHGFGTGQLLATAGLDRLMHAGQG